MPVADAKTPAGFHLEQQPVLFPHRIIAYLFNECKLQIPVEALHDFWDEAISNKVPGADISCRHRIPLGFYGDAAQLLTRVRKEKITCFFLNLPLFRPRSIRCSRFLLWVCDTDKLFRNRTVNSLLRWLVWSFNSLFVGVHPSHRPGNRSLSEAEQKRAGQPITEQGLVFQVTELRGDWEHFKSLWAFRSSWKAINICFRCPAKSKCQNSGLLYWNDSLDSEWSKSEYNTDEFISQMLPDRHICASSLLVLFLWHFVKIHIV